MFRFLDTCDDAAEVPASPSSQFVPDNYDPPLPQAVRRRNWSGAFDASTQAQLAESVASGAGAQVVLESASTSVTIGAARGNGAAVGLAFLFGLIWLTNR